jgi:hypothetical protein
MLTKKVKWFLDTGVYAIGFLVFAVIVYLDDPSDKSTLYTIILLVIGWFLFILLKRFRQWLGSHGYEVYGNREGEGDNGEDDFTRLNLQTPPINEAKERVRRR